MFCCHMPHTKPRTSYIWVIGSFADRSSIWLSRLSRNARHSKQVLMCGSPSGLIIELRLELLPHLRKPSPSYENAGLVSFSVSRMKWLCQCVQNFKCQKTLGPYNGRQCCMSISQQQLNKSLPNFQSSLLMCVKQWQICQFQRICILVTLVTKYGIREARLSSGRSLITRPARVRFPG